MGGLTLLQNARVVQPDGVREKADVLFDGKSILRVGEGVKVPNDAVVIDAGGKILGPGFVDIHCHGGGAHASHENPEETGRYHLAGGTTSLLCTFYGDVGKEGFFAGAERVRRAMRGNRPGNIVGIHMEGPYLSPKYGAETKSAQRPNPEDYLLYMEAFGDLVRQWTVAPELDGALPFIECIARAGIVPALGHTEASLQRVEDAVNAGARICTHLGNATGTAIAPSRYKGTKEVSFDDAVMLQDALYCEIINDREGIHVRPAMSRLMLRCIGVKRAVAVTDCCQGVADGAEANLVDGVLCGSKMKMIQCARNFAHNTGLTVEEVFQVCASNPARAIGLTDVGRIEEGCRPNFVLIDETYTLHRVILSGEIVA